MKLSDKPLKIEGEACGTRIVSGVYKIGDQYAFLDIGWSEMPGNNPFHYIGKLISEGKDKWEFEDKRKETFVITPLTDKDKPYGGDMLADAVAWKKFMDDNGITEEKAIQTIREAEGIPEDVDIQ